MVFEFSNGRKWRQKAYKYGYHYAYRPHARVVDRAGGYYLDEPHPRFHQCAAELGMILPSIRGSPHLLRNHSCRLCQGNELESEGSRFGAEFGFLTFVKTELSSGKVTVVEFLAGSHEVEDDAG